MCAQGQKKKEGRGAESAAGERPPPPRQKNDPHPHDLLLSPSNAQPTVSVTRPPGASTVATPAPGDIVTARVLRTSPRAAGVEILCIDGEQASTPLRYPPPGVIRAAAVRATAVDSVDVGACFRPGDLVRAVVLSLGDARAYYLSTAGDALGVVSARSASHPARPFLQAGPGGQDMACPLTGVTEPRKVARQ